MINEIETGPVGVEREGLSDELVQRIVAAYKRGDKVRVIEDTFQVPRATVYLALRRGGVAPSRQQHRERAASGDDEAMARLFGLLSQQDRRIIELTKERDDLAKQVRTLQRQVASLARQVEANTRFRLQSREGGDT